MKKKSRPTVKKKQRFGEFVLMTPDQYQLLVERFGAADADDRIARLDEYLGSRGDRYKSHYHTILVWARRDNLRGRQDPVDRWTPQGETDG